MYSAVQLLAGHFQVEQSDYITEVTEILHEKLPPMPEKSAFMFHQTFYPKRKMDLDNSTIFKETKEKVESLK